jgi:proteasome accessory factor C
MLNPTDRLGRLLFIVPYVVHRDGVSLAELARVLGTSEAQIEADIGLLSMVGQPPLTPDHLIDLQVEDGMVYAQLDQNLVRPLRLTLQEARALALGASLLGDLGGWAHSLEQLLERLIELLPAADREAVLHFKRHVWVHRQAAHAHAVCLRDCIEAHRMVSMAYYSASSDQHKQYALKPLALFTHAGDDYLVAQDSAAADQEKLFRLDRIGSLTAQTQSFVPPSDFDLEKFRTGTPYFGDRSTTVQVWFAPALRPMVQERFTPGDVLTDDPNGLVVRVATASVAWLSRWVLSFGPEAEILAPAAYRDGMRQLCSAAAQAYRRPPPTPRY